MLRENEASLQILTAQLGILGNRQEKRALDAPLTGAETKAIVATIYW